MLTESQIERSFRKLISTHGQDPKFFEKAEELLDELRAESPLRHRLETELEEIRALKSKS